MGKYVQSKPGQKRSLSDALNQAEQDHFLDCPNADFGIRLAATLLDFIILFIFISSFRKVAGAVHESLFINFSPKTMIFVRAIEIALQGMVIYGALFYASFQFGGTPGKLMLGLRVIQTETGESLSIWQAILRDGIVKPGLLVLTLGVAFLTPLFREDKLALHDLATGSCVKRIHS